MKKKKNNLLNFDVMEHWIDDDKPSAKGSEELSLFEEVLADYIKHWQETGKDPLVEIEDLRHDADEIIDVVIDTTPRWDRVIADDLENGLYRTPTGIALVQDGYFVMVDELVEKLPRIVD